MKTPERSRYIGDEDALLIWWLVNGELVDFSDAADLGPYTFTAILAPVSNLSGGLFTKTTGFTGAVGSGTEVAGAPNLTVAWDTSGELNSIDVPGGYLLQIVATAADGSESTFQMKINMQQRLTVPIA